jgi:hypothetical protein
MKTQITTSAFLEIIKTLGSLPAEQGGIGVGKDGVITDFIHDKFADTSGSTYTLNTPYLNPKLKVFEKEGKKLKAIIHTHPRGASKLSNPDKIYFKSQFKNFEDLDKIYTPIIFSGTDGEFCFFPYVFHKDGRITEEKLEIVPDNYQEYLPKKSQEENTEKQIVRITDNQKSDKDFVFNFHNEVSQGRLDPIIIYADKNKDNLAEKIPTAEVVTEIEAIDKTVFNKIYHGFFIAFLGFVFLMLLSLSPSFYNFFANILN